MALADLTDRQAVLSALSEFDAIGREAFLIKYGFRHASGYFVLHDRRLYDSKAIVGAAHGYQTGVPLKARQFSGGAATVVARLTALGFVVTVPTGPKWSLPIGAETTRTEVDAVYGGGPQGGILTPTKSDNILIYSDPTVSILNGYNFDGWDETEPEVYYYTGQGQQGDQTFAFGNKAIQQQPETGRIIRFFETVDGRDRPGGKVQRYVGAFRLDAANPFRIETAPDRNGDPRKVIVFRLLSITPDEHDSATSGPVRPAASRPTQQPGDSSAERGIIFVDSENNTVVEYETAPRTGAVARRQEALLVNRFEESLREAGHEVERIRIPIPGESGTLVTDSYCRNTNVLYEAKSGADRSTVRLGVGQLLDYLRFIPGAKGCLLLPTRPSENVIAFIRSCGLGLTYPAGDSWISLLTTTEE
ncbi:hypothetical protein ACWCOV_24690 [Kribbella sp. NPDC002412]